jgi:hypothetical protein
MNKLAVSILSVTVLLGLSACGSDETQPVTVVTTPAASTTNTTIPTKGQQLRDLQKAYDDDAINEDEYKAQKARLLTE